MSLFSLVAALLFVFFAGPWFLHQVDLAWERWQEWYEEINK